ncbi:Topoisomerase DNA binding C4 zinc finger fused to uncharacterized N-terminal domain often associated with RecB-like endonuclease [Halapricum desulfuricans]|uniref:Topoisomerase DNA binding C4 zinc finger fused to uncharacterized N-terminal domain often associated with RecB-like endonuclease n=1 Tax=Halapricum desulfuricans TaxID=2841257 RepID=A0A897NSN1_9EURY|nr:hypothetical protein [Halapricum desulfuricans]QSG13196.1 Topoisomerase DNA binding C4 zinc finger fused to uncharacterized N-terminal domain often associated with RecB-like endonuclease [Halapricum desulfuricans]
MYDDVWRSARQRHEQRSRVLVIAKPDNTVLVHNAEGYQPATWLARGDSDNRQDQRLKVITHGEFGTATTQP